MIEAGFSQGRSWMHRIDPRLRVVAAVAFACIVAVSYDFKALATALFLSVIVVALARLSLTGLIYRLMAPMLFLLLLWVVLPWSVRGNIWFYVGPLPITHPGVTLCLQISLKTFALMAVFISLVATMTVDTLGHTLNRLRLPDKMVHMILITYRYLFVIEQEYQRLVRAMKIRSFHPKTNLHTYRTYAYLMGMLFVRASERARRVHSAMICRGFAGRFLSLREFAHNPQDNLFFVGAVLSLVLLGSLEWLL